MLSVSENLRKAAAGLIDGIFELLREDYALRDVDEPGGGFVWVGAPYAFKDLSTDQKRLQSKLLEELHHFVALVRALTRGRGNEVERKIAENEEVVREIVEQSCLVWHRTTEEARKAADGAVAALLDQVSCLHDPTEGACVLVPDTNALIYSPAFADWTFDGIECFAVVLVPALLAELDSLKVSHRNPEVRDKCRKVISQLKEYRRRGELTRGVPIVAERISLRAVAVEPRMEESLPWLDPASSDDRMLAALIEVMRAHPRSAVLLVTGDINLQNKAEFACVPFIEPPTGA